MIPGRLARVSSTLASDIANPGGIAPNTSAPGAASTARVLAELIRSPA